MYITETDGITPKVSHAQRIGSTGDLVSLRIGYPMWLAYSDGHGTLMTSLVENIEKLSEGFKVKTHSTIYVLEKV